LQGQVLDYPVARRKFIRTFNYPDPGLLVSNGIIVGGSSLQFRLWNMVSWQLGC